MTKHLPAALTFLLLAGCVVQPAPGGVAPSASPSAPASTPATVRGTGAPPSVTPGPIATGTPTLAPGSHPPSTPEPASPVPTLEPPMPTAPTFAPIAGHAFAPLDLAQVDFLAERGENTPATARTVAEGFYRRSPDEGYEPDWTVSALRLSGGAAGNWRPDWMAYYYQPDGDAPDATHGAVGAAAATIARAATLTSADTAAAPYEADLLRPWAGARTLHRAATTKLAGGGWHLVYQAAGLAETLHLVVGAEQAVVLRVAFGAHARPQAGLAVSRGAAIAAFQAASADLNAVTEEQRTGKDWFLEQPFQGRYLIGEEPGGFRSGGRSEITPDTAPPQDPDYDAEARRAFGKDHWVVTFDANPMKSMLGAPRSYKLLFTSAPGHYGVIRSYGVVDAVTGKVVRIQRRGSFYEK